MGWLQNITSSTLLAAEAPLHFAAERLADAARVARFSRGRLRFVPRPDDIFVATYPRSGTTWMQYIVHLLASQGQGSFEHISEVAPWWERSLALREDAAESFEQLASPRVFKSHLPFRWLPTHGRYIYVERNGRDVAVSYFKLYRSHLGYRGTFDEFFERFVRGNLQYRSWFKHTAGWRKYGESPRVLSVHYEDMQKDLANCVRRVATFCDLPLREELLATIYERSQLEAMRREQHRFDHIGELLRQRGIAHGTFIGDGKAGAGRENLSEAQRSAFEQSMGRALRKPDVEWRIADFLH